VKSCPGIGVQAALWLASKDPMLLGADNWPVEVAPNPDKQLLLPVHQVALVVNGIHLLENLKLDELAQKGVNSPSRCSRSKFRAAQARRCRRSRCGSGGFSISAKGGVRSGSRADVAKRARSSRLPRQS
jgi:hypothetical protein